MSGRGPLFDQQGQGGAKIVDGDSLLGHLEAGDAPLGEARFNDAENLFGVFKIELGDADAIVETQNLRVKIGHVPGDDQAQRFDGQ